MIRIFAILFLTTCALAGEIRYSLMQFVEDGLATDPQTEEIRHGIEAKKNQLSRLKAEAVLPTFYVSMMVGPAPGLKEATP